jgi:hypothetical protein
MILHSFRRPPLEDEGDEGNGQALSQLLHDEHRPLYGLSGVITGGGPIAESVSRIAENSFFGVIETT